MESKEYNNNEQTLFDDCKRNSESLDSDPKWKKFIAKHRKWKKFLDDHPSWKESMYIQETWDIFFANNYYWNSLVNGSEKNRQKEFKTYKEFKK